MPVSLFLCRCRRSRVAGKAKGVAPTPHASSSPPPTAASSHQSQLLAELHFFLLRAAVVPVTSLSGWAHQKPHAAFETDTLLKYQSRMDHILLYLIFGFSQCYLYHLSLFKLTVVQWVKFCMLLCKNEINRNPIRSKYSSFEVRHFGFELLNILNSNFICLITVNVPSVQKTWNCWLVTQKRGRLFDMFPRILCRYSFCRAQLFVLIIRGSGAPAFLYLIVLPCMILASVSVMSSYISYYVQFFSPFILFCFFLSTCASHPSVPLY